MSEQNVMTIASLKKLLGQLGNELGDDYQILLSLDEEGNQFLPMYNNPQLCLGIEKEEKKMVIIASTDFSHEGYSYGRFPPAGLTSDAFARQQDKMAIQKILIKDPTGLYQIIQRNNISMCGYGGVMALLTVAQSVQGSSVELLKYGTSYDTCSDSNSCVGYGAFAVKKMK